MSVPRLYVSTDLADGIAVALSSGQAHYLRSVRRLSMDAEVALFNGRQGEWRGRVDGIGKGWCSVVPGRQTRPQEKEIDLRLVFAPVKRLRIDFLVEKAAELGVSVLHPVWTERTIVERVNLERLRANAAEAAEQSERLSVPLVEEPKKLTDLLAHWPAERPLFLCDESGAAPPIGTVLAGFRVSSSGAALLIGPEGGFTETELDGLRKLPFVTAVGLGPRVLRADTAALAALAVFQAVAGDWRHARTVRTACDPLPPRR
jgi:16S rRNA (uracil1498-N3)-methyltransferase